MENWENHMEDSALALMGTVRDLVILMLLMLFKVDELQATGSTEGPSCTEVICKWADPKGSKVEPTAFQDLKIKKIRNTNKKNSG